MPKSPKKTGTKKGCQATLHSTQIDFTLADFADSVCNSGMIKSGRVKKGSVNAISNTVKQMAGNSSDITDTVSWYDKDISEFDIDLESRPSNEDEDEEEDNEQVVNGHQDITVKNKEEAGVNYPLDVWFLIGEHIEPDSVMKFASICRGSHFVVHTAKFWSHLYQRYYTSDIDLPTCLQPSYMQKIDGLRARVVRSLFYLYRPFHDRQRLLTPFQREPDSLEGATCIVMWYQKIKNHWHFYFKFRQNGTVTCSLANNEHARNGPLGQFYSDIDHNPEEHCSVLVLITCNFVSLPVVMGQILRSTCLSVGHGMRYHKVKLIFSPINVRKVRGDPAALAGGISLVMDPVLDLRIHHWWEPKYPFNISSGSS